MVPHKKKDYRTSNKIDKEATHNYCGIHHCFVLCKKAEITEYNYMSHSGEQFFGFKQKAESTKKDLGVIMFK